MAPTLARTAAQVYLNLEILVIKSYSYNSGCFRQQPENGPFAFRLKVQVRVRQAASFGNNFLEEALDSDI